jgi:hypothetical protein
LRRGSPVMLPAAPGGSTNRAHMGAKKSKLRPTRAQSAGRGAASRIRKYQGRAI